MSGDVQPRKRKDKKKRKEDGDQIPEKLHTPIFTNNTVTEDVNIHVHKEEGTGGGICAKLVFFVLFSALAVLIGLIITEHRGLTDIETVDPNSKFSQLFEGWVDTHADNHDEHDIEHTSVEEDDHDVDQEDSDEEHDDHIEDHESDENEQELSEEEEEREDDDGLDHQEDDENEEEDENEDEYEVNDKMEDEDEEEDDEIGAHSDEDETEESLNYSKLAESEEDEQDQEDLADGEDEDEQDYVSDENEKEFNDVAQDDEGQEPDDDDEEEVSKEKTDNSEDELDNAEDDGDGADDEYSDKDDENGSKEKDDEEDQINSREEDDQNINLEEEIDGDKVAEPEITNEEIINENEVKEDGLESSGIERSAGKKDSDSDKQSDDAEYEYTNISSEDDYKIRREIDEAQSSIKENNIHAIALFDKILQKFPSSPRSLYGKALALDDMAEKKRSNNILEKAILIYTKLLKSNNVPAALFHLAADRCIDRLRFLGQYKNAIAVHRTVIERFPDDPKHLNNLAITYLTINRIEEARAIFKQVLMKWPEDGSALVHYGFILKTTDNELEKAVHYIGRGIRTGDEGVKDGRFYFHLGDALVRLGRNDDALEIYEEGTKNNVFLSKFQRSLYNVPRLSAKPWWLPGSLPYSNSLKLLSQSWQRIREEGLAILNQRGYFQDESENLRDTGEWKQFELYARGHKNVKNCNKCPFTCSIIDQIPEAKNCKRGQTKFSVMHPGTHIWPHCGPTNCRLRVHLGLKVPSNTFIRVAEETKSWREGQLLIFDDSFEHEVWHNGTEFRLILIVDVWHPELSSSERNNLSPI